MVNLLEPQITIPSKRKVSRLVGMDGQLHVAGQTAAQLGGQIQLANFANPAGLNSIGRNLYQPTDASGEPTIGNPGGQEG